MHWETELKHVQSNDTNQQIGLHHHEIIVFSKDNLVFSKVSWHQAK